MSDPEPLVLGDVCGSCRDLSCINLDDGKVDSHCDVIRGFVFLEPYKGKITIGGQDFVQLDEPAGVLLDFQIPLLLLAFHEVRLQPPSKNVYAINGYIENEKNRRAYANFVGICGTICDSRGNAIGKVGAGMFGPDTTPASMLHPAVTPIKSCAPIYSLEDYKRRLGPAS